MLALTEDYNVDEVPKPLGAVTGKFRRLDNPDVAAFR